MSGSLHRIVLLVVLLLNFKFEIQAQKNFDFHFVRDTMTLTGTEKVLEGEYMEVQLRDQHIVRLFKADDRKVYVRFIIAKNFYFDKVATLEILSGSKTYPIKNMRQWKVNKTRGLFVSEIFTNYLSTLQAEGMTALLFNQAVTKFSRLDTKKIKRMSTAFKEAYLAEEKKTK